MIIGIDPGLSGAIACKTDGKVFAYNMPDTPKDILLLILSMKTDDAFCWIEQVGSYVAGNSATAAVKFARHCGHLDMALIAAGISHDTVLARKWEHWLIGKPNYPAIPDDISLKEEQRIKAKRKTERKNKIKAKVQGLYPDLKVTLAKADAIGILEWAIKTGGV